MSENVQIAIVGIIGSILTGLISAVVTMTASDKRLGCRSILLVVTAFAGVGFFVAVLIAAIVITPDQLQIFEPPRASSRPTPHIFEPIGDRTTTNPTQAAIPVDITEVQKPNLISAIRLANSAEARALFTLDPTPLYNSFTGEALKQEIASVDFFKTNGLFVNAQLEEQIFHTFKVQPDRVHAEVQVTETWSSTWSQIGTQQCVSYFASHEVPQTVFLEYGQNGWLVTAIIYDDSVPQPSPGTC